MNRLRWKFPLLLLAAGITGGMCIAGCASRDARQETVATVNGDPIRVGELRESLGVPAGVFAVPDIPVERKKEALDKLVEVRLLAQEGLSLGLDNTPEFKAILQRSESVVRIKTLMRNEIEGKLKVTDEEIKAAIAKVKKAQPGISDADAAVRAVEVVSWRRVKKITDDLLVTAKKETAAEVDAKAISRPGKGEDVPEDVVHARRGGSMRALLAYAKKQGVDGSEGHKSMRQEMERSVLRGMVADNVAANNIEIMNNEVEERFARDNEGIIRLGKKIPPGIAAQLKEAARASLLQEKRKAVIDAYTAGLRKKAKIMINEDILPKV